MSKNANLSRSGITHSKGTGGRVMLITDDRVVYVGLMGKPQMREFGTLTAYVSMGSPFQIQVGEGEWENAEMYVVAPDTRHRIMTSDRLIGVVMIEADTVAFDRLPEWLQPTSRSGQCQAVQERVRNAFAAFSSGAADTAQVAKGVDGFFFGQALERRRFDPRMAQVIARINGDPCGLFGAEECARQVDLSFSRFLHLFKDDVGTTFRSFRAWKRARSFLAYVNTELSLTHIALEIGYPDSSHFSHSVRYYWGLTPKDIVAGSRQLAVINHSQAQAMAAY